MGTAGAGEPPASLGEERILAGGIIRGPRRRAMMSWLNYRVGILPVGELARARGIREPGRMSR